MIRILIADDNAATRHTARAILEYQRDWEVCEEAVDAKQAIEKAVECEPDIVILDIEMPGRGSFLAARRIKEVSPHTRVLFWSIHDDKQWVQAALLAGASGYVAKGKTKDLLDGLDALVRNETFFPGGSIRKQSARTHLLT